MQRCQMCYICYCSYPGSVDKLTPNRLCPNASSEGCNLILLVRILCYIACSRWYSASMLESVIRHILFECLPVVRYTNLGCGLHRHSTRVSICALTLFHVGNVSSIKWWAFPLSDQWFCFQNQINFVLGYFEPINIIFYNENKRL